MKMFWISWILAFWSHLQSRRGGGGGRDEVCVQKICYHVAAYVILFIWYATWQCSERVEFWPSAPPPLQESGGGGGLRAEYLLPCCCIRDSILFYMQHDHVLQKLNFKLLTPSPGCVCVCVGVVGGSAGQIFATILLHASFPLIAWFLWNMTIF